MLGLGLGLWLNTAALSGAAAPAYSTWNPLTTGTAPSAADYTLSGGNDTAARTSGSGDALVRGTLANTAGYFEVSLPVTGGNNAIGVADAAAATNNFCGSDAGSYSYYAAGQFLNNGGAISGSPATYGTSQTIGVCIKAGKLYFSRDGVWQNGADPSAGTGGIDISAVLGSGLYPAASSSGATTFVINTGASAFTYPLPTGVSAWG